MGNVDHGKVVSASKWSAVTEIVARLVTPVSTIVLARLLTPDAFGVVATITMIISFVEIFTDGGFQKYIIQHEFVDEKDREESVCVAFWSNMFLAFILWGLIAIFCEPLAELVGNKGLGHVIVVACVALPLQALSSVQMAMFKRDFDFKTLFKVRMLGIMTPIVVTIPLALWLRSYWALVFGTIMLNVVNATSLTYFSKFRIRFFYSMSKLREMLSFTSWTMFEAVSIWLTGYIDVFLIGKWLNEYYLGLYKTSMTTVGQIMALITAATTPVLFSALSRLQSDATELKKMFFKFQKIVGLFVFPLGVGIFVFRKFVTGILLGDQWIQAAEFIGLWAMTSTVTIVLAHYSSEVYRSLGKPRLSALAQWLHIIVLIPAMLVAIHYSFEVIYVTRSLVRLEGIAVNLVIMHIVVGISPVKMIGNILTPLLASCSVGIIGFLILEYDDSLVADLITMAVCGGLYLAIISRFKDDWKSFKSVVFKIIGKK